MEWWEAAKADPEHVMFMTYEMMLEQPEEQIVKIADFLGIEHTPEIVAKVNAAMYKKRRHTVVVHISVWLLVKRNVGHHEKECGRTVLWIGLAAALPW